MVTYKDHNLIFIKIPYEGSKKNEIWRKRDKRVIQSGHIKRSCKNKELPFATEYSRTSRFFCRFLTSEKAEDLVVAIARENGISSATRFGEWNVSPPRRGEAKTQWVDMYNLGDTDLSQYLPPPSRKLQRNENKQWVGVEFYFTTFLRRSLNDMAVDLDDSDIQNGIQNGLILPEVSFEMRLRDLSLNFNGTYFIKEKAENLKYGKAKILKCLNFNGTKIIFRELNWTQHRKL